MSLLRTSKHLRVISSRIYFTSRLKQSSSICCSVSPVVKIDMAKRNSLTIRNVHTSVCQFNKTKDVSRVSKVQVSTIKPTAYFQQQFEKLQYSFKENKVLLPSEVEKVLSEMKSQVLGSVTNLQGLMLIRCCGLSIPNMKSEQRTKLVQDVWKTLESLSCPLDVSHYNALLRVYFENDHTFDPEEFLNIMHQANISPNTDTYQCLVSQYCHEGNIDGARKMVDLMKSNGVYTNLDIFSELIIGHAQAKDEASMRRVLDEIRSVPLSPNSSTYTALACGHAILGNIENVMSAIQEAQCNGLTLSNKELLQIIYTLAVNQNVHLTEQVISKLDIEQLKWYECAKVVIDLVNLGYHEIGFHLLTRIHRSYSKSFVPLSGEFFIEHIFKTGLPVSVVMDYCDKLRESGINENALLSAAKSSISSQKTDVTIMIFKKMHSQDRILRPHFFWPILVSKRGNDDKDTLDILKLMADLSCPADFDTLVQYVFPFVCLTDPHEVINSLVNMGYDLVNVTTALCTFLLLKGEIKTVVGLLEKYSLLINFVGMPMKPLSIAFIKSQDISSLMQLLQRSQDTSTVNDSLTDICSNFILELMSRKENFANDLESLIAEMNKKGMNVTGASVQSMLLRRNSNGRVLPYNEHSKELIRHDDDGISHNAETYALLLTTYCKFNDLDKAMHYKKLLNKMYPDFHLDINCLFLLAKLLVDNKRFQDAECLISEYHEKFGKTVKPINNFLMHQLLNGLIESDDVTHPRKMFEMLYRIGYCRPENAYLEPLVKTYLSRDNVVGAVNEYLRIVNEYHVTPGLSMMFQHLIMAEDTERLQNVIDATVHVHGEANMLFSLACAFISCGQLAKAKEVLLTPGLRASADKIDSVCKNFIKRNKIDELEIFVDLTKHVFGVNRGRMYHLLFEVYVKEENVQKALGVVEKMQEEGVTPGGATLQLLRTFFKKINEPVPFDISSDDIIISERNMFVKFLNERNVDGALNAFKSGDLSIQGGTVKIPEICSLIKFLLEDERLEDALDLSRDMFNCGYYPSLPVSRLMAFKLSEVGDRKSLLQLQRRLPNQISGYIPFQDYLAVGHIKSGNLEFFLDSLESDIEKHKHKFPSGGLLAALKENPDILSRVRIIVEKYYQLGTVMGRNTLWSYLMNTKKFEEAEIIFKCTPEMQSNLFFRNVLSHIQIHKDLEVSQKLLDLTRNSALSLIAKGRIYSVHINVLITNNQLDEAMNSLSESERLIGLNHIPVGALFRLKKHLMEVGKDVPFSIPKYSARTSRNS